MEETGIANCLLSEPIQFMKLASSKYYLFELSKKVPFNPKDSFEVMETKWATLEEMKGLTLNAGIQQFIERKSRTI